ncbi:MAG: hypothetical protein ACRC3J_09205 [Culicoidibacterales bacterium]
MKPILTRAIEALQAHPNVSFTSAELAAEILKDVQFAVKYEMKLAKRDYINKRVAKQNRALRQLTETITTLAPRISNFFGMRVTKLNGRLSFLYSHVYVPQPLFTTPAPASPFAVVQPPVVEEKPVQQAKPSVISRVLRFFKRG